MADGLLHRIERAAGIPDLVQALTERLEPTDLQSLLLEVYRRRARKVAPARVLDQYETNRFVPPSPVDPRKLVEFERLAWWLLPPGYAPIALAPVCPLGTVSALGSLDQNRVISTIRNTEVVADPTNVMALECASRRRLLRRTRERRGEPVLLAASQRVTRAQVFDAPGSFAHFQVLCLCAAGRDEGSFAFESARLLEQLAYYLDLVRELARLGGSLVRFRVAVTEFAQGAHLDELEKRVMRPLSDRFPEASCHFDPERVSGRGYYRDVCFKIYAADRSGAEIELADGGMTDWTQKLISDRKERLLISGLGVERLLTA